MFNELKKPLPENFWVMLGLSLVVLFVVIYLSNSDSITAKYFN